MPRTRAQHLTCRKAGSQFVVIGKVFQSMFANVLNRMRSVNAAHERGSILCVGGKQKFFDWQNTRTLHGEVTKAHSQEQKSKDWIRRRR